MSDSAMVARKSGDRPPDRAPLGDEELADQLLGKAQTNHLCPSGHIMAIRARHGRPCQPPRLARISGLRTWRDVGGYRLAYECAGTGRPTVILEAGYTASGIDTYGPVILPALARRTRVCTYDRAGDGLSDARPASVRPLTGATQAKELHTLLQVIRAGPPYVLVGHSYGGMISREFAALYPRQVAGMVLLEASSEPEIA